MQEAATPGDNNIDHNTEAAGAATPEYGEC